MTTLATRRLARLVLCSTLVVGGVAAGLVAASTVERGAAASTIGTELSPEEQALLPLMSPKDRARYLLQKQIQNEAETASLVAQVQRHRAAMDVINNIR